MSTDETPQDHEVIIVRYGTRTTTRSDVFLNHGVYGTPDGPIDMDYFIWVVRNRERTVLVDTGFSARGGARRGRTLLREPVELWNKLGVFAASAPTIVLTHAHYDHAGNLTHFPQSRIVMAEAEYAFWTGPHAHRVQFSHSAEDTEIAALVSAQEDGRIDFFADRVQIAPGIDVLRVGGHTPGQSVVLVKTSDGPVLLASDAVHYMEEYESDLPFMSVASLIDMYAGFDLIRSWESDGTIRHIVPGHDPGTLERFEPFGSPLEGEAAVIGRLS